MPSPVAQIELPPLDETYVQENAYARTMDTPAQYTVVALKAEVKCRNRQLLEALTQLSAIREASEWVSVEDRLPDTWDEYLVFGVAGEVQTCMFIGGDWDAPGVRGSSEDFGITHWQPLPLPPQPASAGKDK